MAFHLVDHPVLHDRITRIRSVDTDTAAFRTALHDASRLLCFEATRELETLEVTVTTPLCETRGRRLARPVVLVPILRAGIGLLRGFTEVFGEAAIGTIGLRRNEETHLPEHYHFRVPSGLGEAEVIVTDPMLATGGSAVDAVAQLKREGATRIRFVCLIAAPEGLANFTSRHPDVAVYAGALDACLNDDAYIFPGLGDAGDRYFGT